MSNQWGTSKRDNILTLPAASPHALHSLAAASPCAALLRRLLLLPLGLLLRLRQLQHCSVS
jgi:hypothetical protein